MNRGFSLIEISVVLIIIALITGGIVTAQNLIRSAEVNTIIQDYQKYVQATDTFRTKYNEIPGDMSNATSIWGAAHATPATCITTASLGKETCDGNGNGRIELGAGSDEKFRFWQHLSNAELISEQFNGVAGSIGINDHDPGVNSPASKVEGETWGVRYFDPTLSGTNFALPAANMIDVGELDGNGWPSQQFLTVKEIAILDKKIDDSKPGSGNLISPKWNDCSLAANASEFDAEYDLESGTNCRLIFYNIF